MKPAQSLKGTHMKKILFFWVLLCFNSLLAQEKQVAVLPEVQIPVITSELNQQFSFFPEIKHFKEALLFQLPDSSFVLEIWYQEDGQTFKLRKPMGIKQLQLWRQQLKQQLEQRKSLTAINQSGRPLLLSTSTVLALGYYGWVLPMALEIHSGKLSVALYMFTGSAGFFLPYYLTKHRPVSNAAFQMAYYGATRGIGHGIFLPMLFNKHPDENTVLLSTVATSMAEGVAGYLVATKKQLALSTTETISVGGDFGAVMGFELAILADLFHNGSTREMSASILSGSALGLAGGWYLTSRHHYSRGDARILESTALLGFYIPMAIVDLSNTKNQKIFAGASLAGTLLGIGFGDYLVKDKNFSYSQGLFIELSEIAGGLLAAGFAYLVSPEEGADYSKIFLTSSAVGATTGFVLMYNNFKERAEKQNHKFSLDFNFSPAGLLNMVKQNQRNVNFPLVQAQVRF